jgi:hypothetical protein
MYYIMESDKSVFWEGIALWWGPNNSGYTQFLENAGKYTKERAEEICNHPYSTSTMHLCSEVDNAAKVMIPTEYVEDIKTQNPQEGNDE